MVEGSARAKHVEGPYEGVMIIAHIAFVIREVTGLVGVEPIEVPVCRRQRCRTSRSGYGEVEVARTHPVIVMISHDEALNLIVPDHACVPQPRSGGSTGQASPKPKEVSQKVADGEGPRGL